MSREIAMNMIVFVLEQKNGKDFYQIKTGESTETMTEEAGRYNA